MTDKQSVAENKLGTFTDFEVKVIDKATPWDTGLYIMVPKRLTFMQGGIYQETDESEPNQIEPCALWYFECISSESQPTKEGQTWILKTGNTWTNRSNLKITICAFLGKNVKDGTETDLRTFNFDDYKDKQYELMILQDYYGSDPFNRIITVKAI